MWARRHTWRGDDQVLRGGIAGAHRLRSGVFERRREAVHVEDCYLESTASTAAVAVSVVVDGAERSPGLTATQLRAHLGRGLPADWLPVDFGDARLWYPPGWQVVFDSCSGSAAGWIATDRSYDDSCLSLPTVIGLASSSRTPVALTPTRTIHGYRLYSTATNTYVVPQLRVAITVRGPASQVVLETLAPSSRAVASAYRESPPSTWHTITSQGLTFKVPPTWPTTTIGSPCSFSYGQVLLPTPVPSPLSGPPSCGGGPRPDIFASAYRRTRGRQTPAGTGASSRSVDCRHLGALVHAAPGNHRPRRSHAPDSNATRSRTRRTCRCRDHPFHPRGTCRLLTE